MREKSSKSNHAPGPPDRTILVSFGSYVPADGPHHTTCSRIQVQQYLQALQKRLPCHTVGGRPSVKFGSEKQSALDGIWNSTNFQNQTTNSRGDHLDRLDADSSIRPTFQLHCAAWVLPAQRLSGCIGGPRPWRRNFEPSKASWWPVQ